MSPHQDKKIQLRCSLAQRLRAQLESPDTDETGVSSMPRQYFLDANLPFVSSLLRGQSLIKTPRASKIAFFNKRNAMEACCSAAGQHPCLWHNAFMETNARIAEYRRLRDGYHKAYRMQMWASNKREERELRYLHCVREFHVLGSKEWDELSDDGRDPIPFVRNLFRKSAEELVEGHSVLHRFQAVPDCVACVAKRGREERSAMYRVLWMRCWKAYQECLGHVGSGVLDWTPPEAKTRGGTTPGMGVMGWIEHERGERSRSAMTPHVRDIVEDWRNRMEEIRGRKLPRLGERKKLEQRGVEYDAQTI